MILAGGIGVHVDHEASREFEHELRHLDRGRHVGHPTLDTVHHTYAFVVVVVVVVVGIGEIVSVVVIVLRVVLAARVVSHHHHFPTFFTCVRGSYANERVPHTTTTTNKSNQSLVFN